MLAKHYGWEPRMESVLQNPYLQDYYENMSRWSLNLEVFFLKERFRDLLEIEKSTNTIVQDRSIFEGVHIFAANNHEMGNMSDRDYETYMGLFDSMMMVARLPDLMVYLRSTVPHLVENIHSRGRDYEQNIQLDYLKNLNNRYEDFIMNKYTGRTLVIDVDNLNFLYSREDFASIIKRIDEELAALQNINNTLFGDTLR